MSRATHIVHLTPLLLVRVCPGRTSETGKKALHHRVDRVDGGLVGQLRVTGSDVKNVENPSPSPGQALRHLIVSNVGELHLHREGANRAGKTPVASRQDAIWSKRVSNWHALQIGKMTSPLTRPIFEVLYLDPFWYFSRVSPDL